MSTNIATVAPELAVVNHKVTCDSLQVAKHFKKQHKNVIQSIEKLQVPDEWYKLNFQPIQIDTDLGLGRTRKDKAYRMTRDGFTILAMGFTGKRAMEFKLAYIEAFNKMEEKLKKGKPEGVFPFFPAESLQGEKYVKYQKELDMYSFYGCMFTTRNIENLKIVSLIKTLRAGGSNIDACAMELKALLTLMDRIMSKISSADNTKIWTSEVNVAVV